MSLFNIIKSKPMSQDEFADKLIKRLAQSGQKRQIHYHDSDFSLKIGENQIFLESHYQRFIQADSEEQDKTLSLIAEDIQVPRPANPFGQVKPLLMPMMRSRMQTNNKALELKARKIDAGNELLLPFAGDLNIGYVIDYPRMMQPVVYENIKQWQVDTATVNYAASTNLLEESKPSFEKIESNIYQSAWADGYDASRLLYPDIFRTLHLKGNYIAIASNADRVWITDNANPQNLVDMLELASEALLNEGKPLTPDILILEGKQCQLLKLAPEHPAYVPHQTLIKLWMQDIYGHQQNALRQIYTDEYNDPFIATYSVGRKKDRIESYTTWTEIEDLEFWLPKTDTIVLVPDEGDGDPLPIAWTHVESVIGKLPVVADLPAPLRHKIKGFPDNDQFNHMKSIQNNTHSP